MTVTLTATERNRATHHQRLPSANATNRECAKFRHTLTIGHKPLRNPTMISSAQLVQAGKQALDAGKARSSAAARAAAHRRRQQQHEHQAATLLLLRAGVQVDRAIPLLSRASQKAPDDPAVWYHLGSALARKVRPPPAATDCTRAGCCLSLCL